MVLSSLTAPLTVLGGTLGSPLTLQLPSLGRPMGLRYRCGRQSGEIAPPGRMAQVLWTPPVTLAEEYPDRTQIPVRFLLDVYAGSEIADSRETQVLLALPEDALPTVTLQVSPETGSSFVQGARALALVTAAGTQGAEILRCTVRCGGLTGQGQRLLFDLPQAGELSVTAEVTDSRGRTAQASVTVSVEPGEAGSETPLLDLAPANRALGIGCRGDRAEALSMGLMLHMEGQRLTGLPEAEHAADALPLAQAEACFLGLRKLWENPAPEAEFPAQTVAASGELLLLEAADQSGGDRRVWELAGTAGTIRVLSGSAVGLRCFRQTETGLAFDAAAPDDSWAVPLAIYALKGGRTE